MTKLLLSLGIVLGCVAFQPTAEATSACYNNVCGQIVCQYGCVQRSVNGVCIANHCTSPYGIGESAAMNPDSNATGYCVSCSGQCCRSGWSFLSAEHACKAACGSFGCFTRCN